MRPLIQHGDVVELEQPGLVPVKGDVVLVQCDRERYVLHRVVRVKGEKFFIRGDAQLCCEGPFAQEDVLGRATAYYSKGRVRSLESGVWCLAGQAWRLFFPVSVWLLRLTVRLRGDKRESI